MHLSLTNEKRDILLSILLLLQIMIIIVGCIILFKDSAYYCYCACIHVHCAHLEIQYLDFLWVVIGIRPSNQMMV